VTLTCESADGSLLLFPDAKDKLSEGTYMLLGSPDDSEETGRISWPGEYEHGGISIKGIAHEGGKQVSYVVTTENLRCGFASSPLQEFSEKDEEMLGELDVLVIPPDDAKKAQKLVEEVDPPVVIIPVGEQKSFKEVLAACGGKDAETVKEVKLKKGSLPTETREVYVLKS
jgi:hypothetical protein